jgi:hypothetical protein
MRTDIGDLSPIEREGILGLHEITDWLYPRPRKRKRPLSETAKLNAFIRLYEHMNERQRHTIASVVSALGIERLGF